MKHIYLTISAIAISALSFAQFGEISNGNFESWSTQLLYSTPDSWENSNAQEFRGIALTVESSDAQDGNSSVELRSALIDSDSLSGYVFQGDQNFGSGVPYTTAFDEVRFQYKSEITSNDSLYLVVVRFMGGTPVQQVISPVAFGTNSNWTQGSVTIGAGTQDEIFIGFVLGDLINDNPPVPGQWARVDNVQMFSGGSAVANISNHSFENWTDLNLEEADDWNSTAPYTASSANVVKSTDANNGSFAAEVSTVQNSNGDTIPGVLSVGVIDFDNQLYPFGNVPYTATPTTFSGAYKYTPSGSDNGYITAEFYQGGIVTVASHTETLSAQSNYMTFSETLTFTGTPDSMLLVIYSGDNAGSVLLVDDLSLSGGDVSVDELYTQTDVYPNPAEDKLTLEVNPAQFSEYIIVNLAGSVVANGTLNAETTTVDVSKIQSGSYLVRFYGADQTTVQKLVIR